MIKIANKAAKEPPTEEVINLRNQGRDNDEIISELSRRGFNDRQIYEAINQADIKSGVEGAVPPPMPAPLDDDTEGMYPSILTPGEGPEIPIPVPSPKAEAEEEGPPAETPSMPKIRMPAQTLPSAAMDIESVQEIVESIIDERWQEVVASVGDITLWKSKMEDDVAAIKQEILRLEDRFSRLQASIIGKVDEYQKGISQVSSEMVALEKVFGKIMEPLTSNIKELQRITQTMKKPK